MGKLLVCILQRHLVLSVYSQKKTVIFLFLSINQAKTHKYKFEHFIYEKARLLRYKPKLRSISSNLMNMYSRMNSMRRARYGYKPFLTSTFAFIYQFMIQKAFYIRFEGHIWLKFITRSISWWLKLPQILYQVALHFCEFSKHRCVNLEN